MELIAGKLNDQWLENLLKQSLDCDWVKAAVAYANGNPKLVDFCIDHNISLAFWGRYDSSVPVSVNILKRFLERKSPNHVCKLVPKSFHPKVIWWGGYGAYIGSANLTDSGWFRNIECGLFLSDSELIEQGLDIKLEQFFDQLDRFAHPLTQEIIDELKKMEEKNRDLAKWKKELELEFNKTRIIPENDSLISADQKSSEDRLKEAFLKEWYETLQIMRVIADRVSVDGNRPKWIDPGVPKGVQADQFLHAYYYNRVREYGNHYPYPKFYERNKDNPEAALTETFAWWKGLQEAPTEEDRTIYEWSPYLRKHLSSEKLLNLSFEQFKEVCERIHAMRDHALRVDNQTYGLPKDTPPKEREECIGYLAQYLWKQRSDGGKTVREVIYHVIYGGLEKDVPLRLWEATQASSWRIPHLGISSLGEMVGWALPDKFPPRNGRSSKALKALGYNVRIHSG